MPWTNNSNLAPDLNCTDLYTHFILNGMVENTTMNFQGRGFLMKRIIFHFG
jgi:hypothetical protein